MNNHPTLTGSEKQVAWASDIRDRWHAGFESMAQRIPSAHKAMFERCADRIMSIPYAAFWIDNKIDDEATPAHIDKMCKRLVAGTLRYKGLEYAETIGLD